jgi:hypothetical protein
MVPVVAPSCLDAVLIRSNTIGIAENGTIDAAAVPEPGSLLVLLIAASAATLIRRRGS